MFIADIIKAEDNIFFFSFDPIFFSSYGGQYFLTVELECI